MASSTRLVQTRASARPHARTEPGPPNTPANHSDAALAKAAAEVWQDGTATPGSVHYVPSNARKCGTRPGRTNTAARRPASDASRPSTLKPAGNASARQSAAEYSTELGNSMRRGPLNARSAAKSARPQTPGGSPAAQHAGSTTRRIQSTVTRHGTASYAEWTSRRHREVHASAPDPVAPPQPNDATAK
jgi:hypothetical protein